MHSPLLILLASVVVLWFGLVAVVWVHQERVVFLPPRPTPATAGLQRIEYTSADGVSVFAYVVGTPAPGRPAVLAFHGNADLSRWFVPWAVVLAERTGGVVVLPEYRGYDGLEGPPTCAGVALDAKAGLDALRWMIGGIHAPIVYFGHSLGAAIAAELAAAVAPDALILQSPFTSARDMARRMWLPGLSLFWSRMSRIPYDNVQRARELDCPIWVSHGKRDLLIPARMGEAVFRAARNPGRLLLVADARHNDVAERGGGAYWDWISAACNSTAAE